jgi:hypothetical protein
MSAPSKGRWQVTTETSVYRLDLDANLVTRVPDAGAGTPPGMSPVSIASLRRDHEPIALLELLECEVGAPLRMILDIRLDGIATLRVSTFVQQLTALDAARTS